MEITEHSAPFRHWVVSGFPTPLLTDELPDIRTWVHYNNDCEHRKRASNVVAEFGPKTLGLFANLASVKWLNLLAKTTGIHSLTADPELHGAGIHVTDPGGWLQPHLDYALHPNLPLERRINLVVFLNREWRQEWGGAFALYDDEGRVPVKEVAPSFGTAVLWEAGDISYHGTIPTSGKAPPRLTAAVYYLAPPRRGCCRKRALFVPNRSVT